MNTTAAEEMPELWQFRVSMYPEKARWALDFKGLPHRRRSLLPGPHVPKMLLRFGCKPTPVLTAGAETIKGSAAIIDWLEARQPEPALYPADAALRAEALALQQRFDDWGPTIRRAFFAAFLPTGGYAAERFATGRPPWARQLYRLGFPLTRTIMRADMKITPRGAAAGREVLRAALDTVAERSAATGYLVGASFTVADLTAASILHVVALPPEYPAPWPTPYPPALERWLDDWADHPGTAWLREMYRRHRGRSAAVADEDA